MDTINKLAQYFSDFPGIGPRQSKRFVYFLLSRNSDYLEDLTRLIAELKRSIRRCDSCFRFFPVGANVNSMSCTICNDTSRDAKKLMIVEKDVDLDNIEKSKVYDGYYFVLGGSASFLDKNPAQKARFDVLHKKASSMTGLEEIILAVSATTDGEQTALMVQELLVPIAAEKNIKISTLGRGLSTGTELEYSDNDTLKNAFKNRQ